MHHTPRQLQGFTLLELVIVITIIALLAAAMLPAYQHHVVRAKISEALNFAGVAKLAVSEAMFHYGDQKHINNANCGIDNEQQGRFIATLRIQNGHIYMKIHHTDSPLDGQLIAFIGDFSQKKRYWLAVSNRHGQFSLGARSMPPPTARIYIAPPHPASFHSALNTQQYLNSTSSH